MKRAGREVVGAAVAMWWEGTGQWVIAQVSWRCLERGEVLGTRDSKKQACHALKNILTFK